MQNEPIAMNHDSSLCRGRVCFHLDRFVYPFDNCTKLHMRLDDVAGLKSALYGVVLISA